MRLHDTLNLRETSHLIPNQARLTLINGASVIQGLWLVTCKLQMRESLTPSVRALGRSSTLKYTAEKNSATFSLKRQTAELEGCLESSAWFCTTASFSLTIPNINSSNDTQHSRTAFRGFAQWLVYGLQPSWVWCNNIYTVRSGDILTRQILSDLLPLSFLPPFLSMLLSLRTVECWSDGWWCWDSLICIQHLWSSVRLTFGFVVTSLAETFSPDRN